MYDGDWYPLNVLTCQCGALLQTSNPVYVEGDQTDIDHSAGTVVNSLRITLRCFEDCGIQSWLAVGATDDGVLLSLVFDEVEPKPDQFQVQALGGIIPCSECSTLRRIVGFKSSSRLDDGTGQFVTKISVTNLECGHSFVTPRGPRRDRRPPEE